MWTWTGLCAVSKLIISWTVGGRDSGYAMNLMDDLRSRLATNRVQCRCVVLRAFTNAFSKKIENHCNAFTLFLLVQLGSAAQGT